VGGIKFALTAGALLFVLSLLLDLGTRGYFGHME